MSDRNKWELYSSKPGWQDCAGRLDAALADAKRLFGADIGQGKPLHAAANSAASKVERVMCAPENVDFGAADTEPRGRLHHEVRHWIRAYSPESAQAWDW